jgi:hypothetical protein
MPNVKQGVCHTLALPFTLKSIFKGKRKNYENSNISPCKNILIFKKSSKRNQNPLTQAKISSFKNPHIKIDLLLFYLGAKIP